MFLEPSCHSYLGDQLKDTKIRQNINVDVDKTYTLLLLPLVDVVLFPGETLPLRISNPVLARKIISIQRHSERIQLQSAQNEEIVQIGIVNQIPSRNGRFSIGTIGTTIEIRSYHCNSSRNNPPSLHRVNSTNTTSSDEITLTGKGRHRFLILSTLREEGVLLATVKLLKDPCISREQPQYALNPFPKWVYTVNSAAVLANRAYELVEKALFWKVQ